MEDICAIVVSYHPDAAFPARLDALLAQVGRIVVVDNGSGPEGRARLAPLAIHPKVKLIANPDNRGIAAALNQGVAEALKAGYGWIATFDQDSTVRPGFFAALREAYAACPEREKVAVLAPRLHDEAVGAVHSFAYGGPCDHELYTVVRSSVTSGNLIPARVFAELGRYREDFFIDYVDHEFCLRCRQQGWLILESTQAVLDHNYGEPTRRKFLWMHPVLRNHSALRRYYQSRNRVVVYRQIGLFDPHWLGRDLREFARDIAKIIFLESSAGKKVGAILRGAWAGLRGKMGKAE
jgi:rhamnosyltransferase